MRKEAYERIFACIQKTRYGVKIINGISTAITYVTAVLYFSVLFWLVWQESYCDACVTIAVPAVSFILVSVFRAKLNARRPYEVYQFQPLIPKDKCGNSFPSRHVFSMFVIGTTIAWQCMWAAVIVWALGIVLAVTRVAGGVHFPKDVIAGMCIGIILGAACRFFLY